MASSVLLPLLVWLYLAVDGATAGWASRRGLEGHALATAQAEPAEPNVLIAYESTSGHTKSLALALARGMRAAGLGEERLRVLPVRQCGVEEAHWAEVVLVGGPTLKGETSAAVALFTEQLAQLAQKHPVLRGRLAAGFATGGAVSAGAEAIIQATNTRLQNAGFTVPSFRDNWNFSTGLVAITGQPPFCQVGQTDRFPHEVGEKAVMSGCEVGADEPPGSIHPYFHTLASEYAGRLLQFAYSNMQRSQQEHLSAGIAVRREVDDLFQQAVPLGNTVPRDELKDLVPDAELSLPAFNVVTGSYDPRSLKSTLLEFKTMRYGVKYTSVPRATAVDRFERSLLGDIQRGLAARDAAWHNTEPGHKGPLRDILDMSEYTGMVFGTVGEVSKGVHRTVEAFAEAVDATILAAVERVLGVSFDPSTYGTDTNPMVTDFLAELLHDPDPMAAEVATLSEDAVARARSMLHLPTRLKGAGIRRMATVRDAAFIGCMNAILPRFLTRNSGTNTPTPGFFHPQLGERVLFNQLDAASGMWTVAIPTARTAMTPHELRELQHDAIADAFRDHCVHGLGIAVRREVDDLFQQAVPLGNTVPRDELKDLVPDAELSLPAFNVVTGSYDPRSLKSTPLEFKTMRYGVKYTSVPRATAMDQV
eukprot:jgi/Tetstr1/455713/TSEL_042520.t1